MNGSAFLSILFLSAPLATSQGVLDAPTPTAESLAASGSLLGPFDGGTTTPSGPIDIASIDDVYLSAWIATEAGMWTVFGQWFDANGAASGSEFVILGPVPNEFSDISVGTFRRPQGGVFLVTYSVDAGAGAGDFNIAARLYAPLSTSALDLAAISSDAGDDLHPDVTTSDADTCTVLWETSNGIEGAGIGVDVLSRITIISSFDVSTNPDDEEPSVVEDEDGNTYAVWRRDPAVGNNQILSRQWTATAPFGINTETVLRGGGRDMIKPVVASSGPHDYFVAWQEEESVGVGVHNIRGRRAYYTGGNPAAPQLSNVTTLAFQGGLDEIDPELVFTGNAYALSFQEALGGNWFLEGITLDTMDLSPLGSFSLQFAVGYGGHGMAPLSMSASDEDEMLSVWTINSVWGQREDTEGGALTKLSAGCSNGGGETRASTAMSGNSDFSVELWNAAPNLPATLAIADGALFLPLGSATLIFDPIVTVGYNAGTTNANGWAKFDIAIPPGLTGATVYLQWLVLDPGATCTGFPVHLSDGLSMTID